MSQFTRSITISSNDLGKDSTLLLVFDKLQAGMYFDKFPVAWKVASFPAQGAFVMNVSFGSRLAVCTPIVESDKIVGNSACVDINPGQKTDLTPEGFTPPEPGRLGPLQVSNRSGRVQDIALAFKPPPSPPMDMLYFPRIRDGSTVMIAPQPFVLQAYITSDYQEGQILHGPIPAPVIWAQDLAALPESSHWHLTFDPVTGHYAIVPSN